MQSKVWLFLLSLFPLIFGGREAKAEEFFHNLPLPVEGEPQVVGVALGFGSRDQRIAGASGWEERLSFRSPLGDRLLWIGEVGMNEEEGIGLRTALATGVRLDLSYGAPFPLAFSGSVRREYGGGIALESRLIGGVVLDRAQFLFNLVGEKAFAPGRDPLDLHLRAGHTVRVSSRVSVGIEYVGDELEALWEPEEAERGSRHFFGPLLELRLLPTLATALEPGVELHLPEAGDPRGSTPRLGSLWRLDYSFASSPFPLRSSSRTSL